MKKLNIGLLGYGTVGKGVVDLINENHQELMNRTGYDLNIVAASKRNWNNVEMPKGIECTTDSNEIVNRSDIDVILELIGGDSVAYDLVVKAIENKKQVVTANKALIATKGAELFQKAKASNVQISFEASVAGGIPIIKSLKEGLAANRIDHVAGIINGTSNYILTSMRNEGRSFSDVLAEAQELGYAEADPSFDIDGIDAAHKITIMASISFGLQLDFSDVTIEGISHISRQDIAYAEELGYQIKHLGIALRRENGVEVRVHPTLVPNLNLISKVDGVMNAVRVYGNAVGETLFYGAGAGSLPTASAVVADVIDLVNRIRSKEVDPLGYNLLTQQTKILPVGEHQSANYLRMTVKDKLGILSKVTHIFANNQISIDAMIQKEPLKGETHVPLVFLTESVSEKNLQAALTEIEQLDAICSGIVRIRVEHF